MENVIWKPIPEYEGFYEVSNTGLVKSIDRVVVSKNNIKFNFKGQFLKLGNDKDGYKLVILQKNGNKKTKKVHSLVALTFIDCNYKKKGLQVNHKDNVKYNNLLSNLEVVTMTENIRHRFRMGFAETLNKGERNPSSKLTLDQINEIRNSNLTGIALGKKFSTSPSNISMIKNRKRWNY